MNILILGGTEEARILARSLDRGPHSPLYGSASAEPEPPPCPRHEEAFQGLDALTELLRHHRIELVVDATDPYARTISLQAFEATERAGIPLWGYQRPPWRQEPGDRWIQTPDWRTTLEMSGFTRPLIALDGDLGDALTQIPKDQTWYLWTQGDRVEEGPGYRLIARPQEGGLADAEEQLLDVAQRYEIDAVVTRDRGGPDLTPELKLARTRDLAVIFQARPALPEPRRLFNDINTLLLALNEER